MTDSLRKQLNDAVAARLAADAWFPPVADGEPDREAWRVITGIPAEVPPAAEFLSLLDEDSLEETGDVLLGLDRPIKDWNLTLMVAYAVRSASEETRRARLDEAQRRIGAALLPEATAEPERSTLGGLCNRMWLTAPEPERKTRSDNLPTWVIRMPVKIWFSAADPTA